MRKALGLTQEDVAKELGVTTRTVINWENGHHEPKLTIRQIRQLCNLFKISFDELPDHPMLPADVQTESTESI